ncbi:ATP-binding cassette domain-containing protein [Comamonas testosteroni]|uniref:ABC transporter related n=1 Tax=Comamonas testosteroni (strain DSM 14576 / KF-1) TaxID=399795 RepID=B7WU44_COMTK|nr:MULTISPECIES: ATP-binding cassette domain-containing protein [Comamonas]EED69315.1 ABC transporter related [Comamonas testosteroni KF-1]TYK72444.1 ATP-binding cassette domain-containing protein [Comamonas sp. Z3]WQG67289.1 ATP-binding cassette domain-containing protein [Comamonas testosteroni]
MNGPAATGATGVASEMLLRASGLKRAYSRPRTSLWHKPEPLQALRGVSFELPAGQSLGVVGESGSGKSTLARLVMALDRPSEGTVELLGRNLHQLGEQALRAARRDFQMVFQDPYGSLDPRMTVERIVSEPLATLNEKPGREARRLQVLEVLEQVGLRAQDADKYPHEFSGGQRQRIAIARALITRPRLIVADEPVSALDVSVQAQVLNLMQDLQRELGLSYLFISHDLAVVQHVCDQVLVLHQGLVVERGTPRQLFSTPAHPYTQALVRAAPRVL